MYICICRFIHTHKYQYIRKMWQVKGVLDVAPCGPERIPFRAAVALFAMGAMAFFQDTFLLFAMAPMEFFQAQPLKMGIVETQGWPPKPAK